MTNQQTLSILSLVALATFLVTVDAWSSTSTAFAQRHPSRTTKTQLSAWSLPLPTTSRTGASYWYQDCGTAIERPIMYNDDDDDAWQYNEDGLGFAFNRLSYLEDDLTTTSIPEEENKVTTRSLPIRMLQDVWKRIRRDTA